MSLDFPDVHGTSPSHPEVATAAYEDAELLLSSILPDARIERLEASAGAAIDIRVAVALDTFDEALGVLCEAGYLPQGQAGPDDRSATLSAPDSAVAVTLHLVESMARREAPSQFTIA